MAIDAALEDVRKHRALPVPKHLRDAHYAGAKQLGHGEGYQYAHDGAGRLGGPGVPRRREDVLQPTDRGEEAEIARRLEELRSRRSRSGE